MTYGISPLVAEPLSHVKLADDPLFHFLDGFLDSRTAADLGAVLNDAMIFSCRFHHLASFPDIVRTRFFYVHVFARLASPDGTQRMPMIGSSERNGINGLIFQELSDVCKTDWFLSIGLFELIQSLVQHVLVNVAQGSDFHIHRVQLGKTLDVLHAPSVQPNVRHPNSGIGSIGYGSVGQG